VNREEKTAAVAALHDRFKRATVTLLASSQGLPVHKIQQLRRAVKQAGGEYKVTKNTFARRAVRDTAYVGVERLLDGPSGLIFGYSDPVTVTKVLVKFAEGNEKLSIKAAILDNRVLEPAAVAELAKLPGRGVLMGMLLGLMQAPAAQLLRTIREPGARLARLIERVRVHKEENAETQSREGGGSQHE
jgi:ribosomal protein L10